ncbi:MAG: ABC-type transport auxiliary lipoprotein family protein [Alphaproteobacteria bacterium]
MRLRSLIPAALACIALSGCVTLLPKAEPSALYKLAIDAPRTDRPDAPVKLNILRAPTAFVRMAAGDQIVTISGAETASIEGARWAAPAPIMFDEQIITAFDASPKLRLQTRGGVTAPDATLRVEVRTFEARYAEAPIAPKTKSDAKADAKAFDKRRPPTVVVEIKATLTYPADAARVAEQFLHAEVPASENRVGAIVTAYDAATTQVLKGLVTWAEGLPPPPAKPVPQSASPR